MTVDREKVKQIVSSTVRVDECADKILALAAEGAPDDETLANAMHAAWQNSYPEENKFVMSARVAKKLLGGGGLTMLEREVVEAALDLESETCPGSVEPKISWDRYCAAISALRAARGAAKPQGRYSLMVPSNMIVDCVTGKELNSVEVLALLNAQVPK